jgi:stage V sporulation protein R
VATPTVERRDEYMSPDPKIREMTEEIAAIARGYGLDFFDTIFEVVDFDQMNEVASYGGFPNRYPHWQFGMEYERVSKGYRYGLQKIYELVINNDPCYAYLLECNDKVDQKMVIAHVFAHSDFFKNNHWFSHTNRKMVDEMANHGARARRYAEKFGIETVEAFLDLCLSIDELIDYHSPFFARRGVAPDGGDDDGRNDGVRRIKSKSYMDRYINPKEYIEEQKRAIAEKRQKKRKIPEDPEKDVLLFLIEHARLARWQRDILSLVREESYYFAPQGQTKIMNEGWATFWHSRIMTEKVLNDSEIVDYADRHSGTVSARPGHLNPYGLGLALFRDIEERWNKGKFGKDYEECEDLSTRRSWDLDLGLGMEKIFAVRKLYNDITFIDEFLTEDFCRDHRLFTYNYNPKTKQYEITSREFAKIKQQILFSLTNFGRPFIYVVDGNYENRGDLLLSHRHEGVDLRMDEAKDTIKSVQKIWGRPVHLRTELEGKGKILSYDGENHEEKDVS